MIVVLKMISGIFGKHVKPLVLMFIRRPLTIVTNKSEDQNSHQGVLLNRISKKLSCGRETGGRSMENTAI